MAAPSPPIRLGCVAFLNALPLIDGLQNDSRVELKRAVPSELLEWLETDRCDVALCPVIDYHRASIPLSILPAGGIGCEGPTWTVRLFSRTEPGQIRRVRADTDSHTSVALLRVLLAERYGVTPPITPWKAGDTDPTRLDDDAILLIGDKVMGPAAPDAADFPHRLDLGEAWHEMTGLPFVFATWMARSTFDPQVALALLETTRQHNASRIDEIADTHAPDHGWDPARARRYLGHMLRYAIGPREIEAMRRFGELAARHGAIEKARSLVVTPAPTPGADG